MGEKARVIQVVGPTASGKTAFSVELAQALDAELINVDSMQVYKDLSVGTDKPSREDCARVRVHGIDLIELGPPMDASTVSAYVHRTIEEIQSRHNPCILSGGTGLYHRAVVHGLLAGPSRDDDVRARLRAERDEKGIAFMYARLQAIDPVGASRIYATDWVRIERGLEYYLLTGRPLSAAQEAHGFKEVFVERLCLGCTRPRPLLYEKIEKRLDLMWNDGIMEETKMMLDRGLSPEQLPLKALGYRQAAMYLRGECSREEALELAKRETRRFAKRQLTWFRADKEVHWLELPLEKEAFSHVCEMCRAFLAQSEV